MPTPDQPTASDREADLQRICEEVEREWDYGGLSENGDLYSDYAKEVARRYAATVGAGVPEEVRKAFEGVEIGPVAYRPQELDDWGIIRQAAPTEEGWRPVVASLRIGDSEDELSAARREGREPRSVAALGPAFVAAFNWALKATRSPSPEPSPSEQE